MIPLILLFKFICYGIFGMFMETVVSSVDKMIEYKWNRYTTKFTRNRTLEGKTSLFMFPVYGLFILVLFDPVFYLIGNWNIFIRYIIYGICFCAAEAGIGLLFKKYLNMCPWNYSYNKWSICQGTTAINYIPFWGIAGLVFEQVSKLVTYLAPYFAEFILY